MRKRLTVCLISMIALKVVGQDLDTLAMDSIAIDTVTLDSIKEPPPYYLGTYIALEAQFNPHYLGYNSAISLGIGAKYNRWIGEFNVVNFNGRIEEFLVFPNVFELDYRYGGPTIGYEVLDSDLVSWDLAASFLFGDIIWRNRRTREDFLRDKFSVMVLSTKVDLELVRFVKPYVEVGYQKANNLDLTLINSEDFSGLVLNFGIQIGYFNQ